MSYKELPPVGDLAFAFALMRNPPEPSDAERAEMFRIVMLYSEARAQLGTLEADCARLTHELREEVKLNTTILKERDHYSQKWRQFEIRCNEMRGELAEARDLAQFLVGEYVSCMTADIGPEPRDGFGGLYCRMCRISARIPEHLGGLQHASDCLVGKAEKLLKGASQ